jgi:adenylate cyclase
MSIRGDSATSPPPAGECTLAPQPLTNGDRPFEHRLAVLLCADVVGYSRLMGTDEEGTLAALTTARRELIDPAVSAHRGRIVRTTGDGLLVEFQSVADAVRCALQVQRAMLDRDPGTSDDRRIRLRVGINVGDVIANGDMVYGDGVTIAARLEALAEPGGICISRPVRDQVRDRLPLALEDIGERSVAGVGRAVRVYRIRVDHGGAVPVEPQKRSVRVGKTAIAVLPFQIPEGGSEIVFFRDSIGEDLITELSRARWFSIVARNSSFAYKDNPADTKQIARELGVRYVLGGSIRTAGKRVRISCQLTDAGNGQHLWANRFDGTLEDSFDLQDQVCESVVGAVDPVLRGAEIERALGQPTGTTDPYDLWLRALPAAFSGSQEDNHRAQRLLNEALDLAPGFAASRALLAWCRQQRYLFAASEAADDDRQAAKRLARAAIKAGQDDPPSLALAAAVLAALTRDADAALAAVDRALLINPRSAFVLSFCSITRCLCGAYDKAVEDGESALRLSPFDPLIYHANEALAWAYLMTGLNRDAVIHARQAVGRNPTCVVAHSALAIVAARTGADLEAAAAVRAAIDAVPEFRTRSLQRIRFADAAVIRPDLALLQAAGLPD